MTEDLRPLLIPPQEKRLRSRFDLEGAQLRLITSGWHRLVVAAAERVFVFPRHLAKVAMIVREADVLSVLDLDFVPRLLGLHRDDGISPYPFLELTRIPGSSYDAVEASLSFEDVAECLEGLGRRVARLHQVVVPSMFEAPPDYLDTPRISEAWMHPDSALRMVLLAAKSLAPHMQDVPVDVWWEALIPVVGMERTTVHGELSDGQFLIDDRLHVTGVVDWNGLHISHPFRDLDFGIGGYRICRWEQRWTELRRGIWEAYASERGISLPERRSVNLFWCLLDAMTLLHSKCADARLSKTLADLSAATGEF